jgi:plasmid maintenance system antidote protein VapI
MPRKLEPVKPGEVLFEEFTKPLCSLDVISSPEI